MTNHPHSDQSDQNARHGPPAGRSIDAVKVARLRGAIEAGDYRVNPNAIAEALLVSGEKLTD